MKRSDLLRLSPLAAVLAGCAALFLRTFLYMNAVDATGRIAAGHPLSWVLAVLSLAVAGLCLWAVRGQGGSGTFEDNFSQNFNAFVGHAAFAYGILMTVLRNDPPMSGALGAVWTYLGYLSAPCLVMAGLDRMKGRRPNVLTHMIPTLFLTVHLINHYQLWCSDPQIQDVLFPLFAVICLTMAAYQMAAFDADMGSRRQLLLACFLSPYLCLGELVVGSYTILYTTGMFWAITGCCAWKEV